MKNRSRSGILILLILLSILLSASRPAESRDMEKLYFKNSSADVEFVNGAPSIGRQAILNWIKRSAQAVTQYYGMMPVKTLSIKIHLNSGGKIGFATAGIEKGRAEIEIPLGENISENTLTNDWVLPHEMVHLAFPLVWKQHRWLTEGMATYIEPFARLQINNISAQEVWFDLIKNCKKGLPRSASDVLEGTSSIDRMYWGGAIFCLVADLQIRKKTDNRMGLQDAMKAICKSGTNIESDTEPRDALRIGDKAIGSSILIPLYDLYSTNSVSADLKSIFNDLGVKYSEGQRTVSFDNTAPLAKIRKSINSGSAN